MNIEKLVKHLKEFTLDEINMIAECDCKTELEHLLNSNKIMFKQGLYKYREEKLKQEFIICTKQATNFKIITFDFATNYFLENYTRNNCKYSTFRKYRSSLKYHILPFFRDKMLNDRTCNFQVRRLSNKTNFTLDRIIVGA